jgi:hypothetical protein
MKNQKLYAVIQAGYSAFGIGKTRDEAIKQAAETYQPDDAVEGDAEEQLRTRIENAQPRIHGEFYVIDNSNEIWNDYVEAPFKNV